MNKILLITMFLLVSLNASDTQDNNKTTLEQEHLKKNMEDEQKYAQEQTFYQMDNYDFQGAEVNPKSLKNIPDLELDDLDMDSVYD